VHADGIYISDLRKSFSIRRRELVALDNVDLEVERGSFVALLGPVRESAGTLLGSPPIALIVVLSGARYGLVYVVVQVPA
jgi:predicted ABC-type transport system involved in lysophospholipase L1 biosynthesis ATPase subunit